MLSLRMDVTSTPPMPPPRFESDADFTDERVAELYGCFSPRSRASSPSPHVLPSVPAAFVGEASSVVVVPVINQTSLDEIWHVNQPPSFFYECICLCWIFLGYLVNDW